MTEPDVQVKLIFNSFILNLYFFDVTKWQTMNSESFWLYLWFLQLFWIAGMECENTIYTPNRAFFSRAIRIHFQKWTKNEVWIAFLSPIVSNQQLVETYFQNFDLKCPSFFLSYKRVCSKQLDLAFATPLYVRPCPAGLRHFFLLGKVALAQGDFTWQAATDCST